MELIGWLIFSVETLASHGLNDLKWHNKYWHGEITCSSCDILKQMWRCDKQRPTSSTPAESSLTQLQSNILISLESKYQPCLVFWPWMCVCNISKAGYPKHDWVDTSYFQYRWCPTSTETNPHLFWLLSKIDIMNILWFCATISAIHKRG